MGASNSRIEGDKALQLCRERKKFVKEALDGRCSLASTHVAYIQSLKIVGTALRRFVEPEAPIESSLYTSTSATPEPLVFSDSQFSFSSPSTSQRVDTTENLSLSPSPPNANWFQANYMKFRGTFSRKVEENPSVPVVGSVISSSTPQSNTPHSTERSDTLPFETPLTPAEHPPWDYFGLFHPIDNHLSSQEGSRLNQVLEHADDIRRLREGDGISEFEDEEQKVTSPGREQSHESEDEFDEPSTSPGREQSQESEDEFDEPSTETLVRSFDNVNRAPDHGVAIGLPDITSAESVASATEFLSRGKSNSSDLSPLSPAFSGRKQVKEDGPKNSVTPQDFFSRMKDIESLFIKASESGREVPRMLEANEFHFRPVFPGKETGAMIPSLFKTCFSCGEHLQVPEDPAQTSVKYLTWNRTMSPRSSSFRNLPGASSRDDIEELTNDLFDKVRMISGNHASTFDQIYAWERKLYDEVKASELVRKEYDLKCKLLRQLESKGESLSKVDKSRAVVKDLHSRIRVAIHIIDSISKKIEELRDNELQPQLEELIDGLRKMWEMMFECHKRQFHIISIICDNVNVKISLQSDAHRQITFHLGTELHLLSSSFTKWISAQTTYVKAINEWLFKCVSLPQKSSRRKRKLQPPPLRNFGPPIYATCDVWLEMLASLPTSEVTDSLKGLAAEVTCHLPRQEKNQGQDKNPPNSKSGRSGSNGETAFNLLRDEAPEDWITGSDQFRSSLVGFLGKLSNFAESSLHMFAELQKKIQEAKTSYAQLK